MAVVKINALHVPEGNEDQVEKAFAAHQGSLDGTPGFLGYELLRPTGSTETRYFVYTRWESDEAFRAWRATMGGPGDRAHGGGGESPTSGNDLLEFELLQSSDGHASGGQSSDGQA